MLTTYINKYLIISVKVVSMVTINGVNLVTTNGVNMLTTIINTIISKKCSQYSD